MSITIDLINTAKSKWFFLIVSCIFRHSSLFVCNTSAEVRTDKWQIKDYTNGIIIWCIYCNKSFSSCIFEPLY